MGSGLCKDPSVIREAQAQMAAEIGGVNDEDEPKGKKKKKKKKKTDGEPPKKGKKKKGKGGAKKGKKGKKKKAVDNDGDGPKKKKKKQGGKGGKKKKKKKATDGDDDENPKKGKKKGKGGAKKGGKKKKGDAGKGGKKKKKGAKKKKAEGDEGDLPKKKKKKGKKSVNDKPKKGKGKKKKKKKKKKKSEEEKTVIILKKTEPMGAEIEEIYGEGADLVFERDPLGCWCCIFQYLSFDFKLESMSEISKAFNLLVYHTFSTCKLTGAALEAEQLSSYRDFILSKYQMYATYLDASEFKQRKLLNVIVDGLPNLTKIHVKLNKKLVGMVLPQKPKIKHLIIDPTESFKQFKLPSIETLTIVECDNGTPIQGMLDGCPKLKRLEFIAGWEPDFSVFEHKRLQCVVGEEDVTIEFNEDMSHSLGDNLPKLQELGIYTGRSIIESESLKTLKCSEYKGLEETLAGCPKLTCLHARDGALNVKKCEFANLIEADLAGMKVKPGAGEFFEKAPWLKRVRFRNSGIGDLPPDDEKFNLPNLEELLLGVEATFPSEKVNGLIEHSPRLRTFTLIFGARAEKRDNVGVIMKRVVVKHKNLASFTCIETAVDQNGVYVEVPAKLVFELCPVLNTVAIESDGRERKLKRKVHRKMAVHRDFQGAGLWAIDGKIYTEEPDPSKLLNVEVEKAADLKPNPVVTIDSPKIGEDSDDEDFDVSHHAAAKTPNTPVPISSEQIARMEEVAEEEAMLARAERIMQKNPQDYSEEDEHILREAEEIMIRRKMETVNNDDDMGWMIEEEQRRKIEEARAEAQKAAAERERMAREEAVEEEVSFERKKIKFDDEDSDEESPRKKKKKKKRKKKAKKKTPRSDLSSESEDEEERERIRLEKEKRREERRKEREAEDKIRETNNPFQRKKAPGGNSEFEKMKNQLKMKEMQQKMEEDEKEKEKNKGSSLLMDFKSVVVGRMHEMEAEAKKHEMKEMEDRLKREFAMKRGTNVVTSVDDSSNFQASLFAGEDNSYEHDSPQVDFKKEKPKDEHIQELLSGGGGSDEGFSNSSENKSSGLFSNTSVDDGDDEMFSFQNVLGKLREEKSKESTNEDEDIDDLDLDLGEDQVNVDKDEGELEGVDGLNMFGGHDDSNISVSAPTKADEDGEKEKDEFNLGVEKEEPQENANEYDMLQSNVGQMQKSISQVSFEGLEADSGLNLRNSILEKLTPEIEEFKGDVSFGDEEVGDDAAGDDNFGDLYNMHVISDKFTEEEENRRMDEEDAKEDPEKKGDDNLGLLEEDHSNMEFGNLDMGDALDDLDLGDDFDSGVMF